MARASLPRILITVVLMLWTPWCFCRVGGFACCGPTSERSDDSPCESGVPSCCSGHCADDDASDKHDDAAPSKSSHDGCSSVCCAPKLPTPSFTPAIPCDTVGCDLPPTMVADAAMIDAERISRQSPWHWPPGATSGRDVLLFSSILRT
ncbi:MAG: hypothetical protein U0572_02355 [Phycisphaerales bacterium]